ncbi:GMC family oxidoreductase [Pelagibaculum spongiae]|uniref:GMC family oxidoreductase n=1 Tax=Pelagibaculum spongiae TaxID=2080658 RepID=A0A2V1GRA0_9GAMM|nr:GMC family oxidoreductase N-terminal domain-containing protein [Pelagibaculum spongiae]PVZ63540.1 GMC family oxidoreductase [Pelagibaculum spongiae]
MMQTFDYLIIGGGSAGCVLANRLSENPENKVCLLEAGSVDSSQVVDTPMGIAALIQWSKFNWMFDTTEQPAQQGRKIYCPRGKGLGGGSSINAMLYVRGQPNDYLRWQNMGCDGWGWNDLLPYFIKSQHQERGANQYHGVNGPLNVSDIQDLHPVSERLLTAALQVGHKWNNDFNDGIQEGVGYFQTTIKKGRRHSAARAYLDSIKDRDNLTILTDCQVEKINFSKNNGDETSAESVLVNYQHSKQTIKAAKEIILSAGSFQSPQLLMLSGIGDKQHLAEQKIDTIQHLPAVGQNLQEHVDIVLAQRRQKTDTLSYSPLVLFKQAHQLFNYLFRQRGILSSPVTEAGGFIKSAPEFNQPDLQLLCTPSLFDDHGRNWKLMAGWGYSAHCTLLQPKSRGSVRLKNNNPQSAPLIDLNMLSADEDIKKLVIGVKKIREIFSAPALKKYRGEEVFPGARCQTDQQIEAFIRSKSNHTYHPVGTCRMGSDADSVVDTQLRVRGIQKLRVVDASVMPCLISGNTNAPVIAMAERAADLIQQKPLRQLHPTQQSHADYQQSAARQAQLEIAFSAEV